MIIIILRQIAKFIDNQQSLQNQKISKCYFAESADGNQQKISDKDKYRMLLAGFPTVMSLTFAIL